MGSPYFDPYLAKNNRTTTFFFAGSIPELSLKQPWKPEGSDSERPLAAPPHSCCSCQGAPGAVHRTRPSRHRPPAPLAPPAADHEPEVAAAYSWGARQTVARLFQHHPGFKIHHHHINDLEVQLASSKFCLAPAGWGWGGRMKVALLHGCVPVIVQVGLTVPEATDVHAS